MPTLLEKGLEYPSSVPSSSSRLYNVGVEEYKVALHKLTLSVHELVDFLLRQGDIDNRIYNMDTMLMGSKIHASFQKKQGNEYLSEVPLISTFICPLGEVTLEGRADGIILGGPFPIIDEIKSTVAPLEVFYEEQKEWHMGQAKCYALMYLLEQHIDKAAIRLTYISQIDEGKMVKEEVFTLDELQKDIDSLLDRYLAIYQSEIEHFATRNDSAKTLSFPFGKFRSGQRVMAKYVYGVARSGGTFFCEAPTGIGKTMSSLYPSIKSFSKNTKIFYLTAKGSGAASAYKALSLLMEKGLKARDSYLKSKEKMCPDTSRACNPDECPLAKGYYEKLRKVMEGLDENRLTEDYVKSLAASYAMCPFELQLDLSLSSDIIVADYNYLFDPLVKLERYFGDESDPSSYLVIIDEAHNLIDRGRDMYSSSLTLEKAEAAKKSLSHFRLPSLKRSLGKVITALENVRTQEDEETTLSSLPKDLLRGLEGIDELGKSLIKKKHPSLPKGFKDFGREAHRFLFLLENYASHSSLYFKKEDQSVNLFCLDPSEYLSSDLKRLRGRILFSGTLSPIDYYLESIMGEKDDPYLLLPSPFPKKNFSLILAPTVSTRYKDRERTYEEVAKYLTSFVDAKIGNYFIYFPSYAYLEAIKPFLSFRAAAVFAQNKEMSEEDKNTFLDQFKENPSFTSVGLLIIGGSYSEGVDLVGNRLSGVAVVGIGLPQLSYERNLLRGNFDKKGLNGYEFAYMDPGINKVMQAVGRLIRSENDVGAALLIDDRYLEDRYRDIFKRRWSDYEVAISPDDVKSILATFYSKN